MKAHELLSDESKWCKGCHCRDVHGNRVQGGSATAYAYSLSGVLLETYRERAGGPMQKVFNRIGRHLLRKWNDAPERTFAEVKAVLVELDL